MKFKLLLIGVLLLPIQSHSNVELEAQYLASVYSQLDVLSSLILDAERQQDIDQRIMFDYLKLRGDIKTMRDSLLDYQDATLLEPRTIAPIDGDYIVMNQAR